MNVIFWESIIIVCIIGAALLLKRFGVRITTAERVKDLLVRSLVVCVVNIIAFSLLLGIVQWLFHDKSTTFSKDIFVDLSLIVSVVANLYVSMELDLKLVKKLKLDKYITPNDLVKVIIFVISSITLVFGMIINSDLAKIFCQFVLVVCVITLVPMWFALLYLQSKQPRTKK